MFHVKHNLSVKFIEFFLIILYIKSVMEYINNRFRIIKKIDEGSMGIVYRGEDLLKNEKLVLKVINLDSSETPSLKSFKQEYDILKQINHPHIVNVKSFTELWSVDKRLVPPKYYLISMEDIRGQNLMNAAGKIKKKATWIRIIKQAVETLNYIHFNGIQHNDIRSNNIYITEKEKNVKFLDFGISEFLDSEDKINRIKKASDWKDFFLLFQGLLKKRNQEEVLSFVNEALKKFNFKKGFGSRAVVDFFNSYFTGSKIIPAWIKYNPDLYLTPQNSGIFKKYKKICSFIDKDRIKEKILFITGDEYTEALLLYFRALDYFQYNNYIPIKIRASNILDTLFSIITRIKSLDVENNFFDEYEDFSNQILNRDSSILDGNKKFITYNKITQLLKRVSHELNLLFDIPMYGMLTENQTEFFYFLLNSTNLPNVSWIFYDTVRTNSFEKYLNQSQYNLKFFEYDYLSFENTKNLFKSTLLLLDSEISKYTNLIKTVHKKANGKFLSIIRFLNYLFQKNYLTYNRESYSFDLKKIKKCLYSFSYEKDLEKILSSLSKEEKKILSLLVFINRNTKISTIYKIFKKENIKKALDSLIEKKLLEIMTQQKNDLIKIKFLTFKKFCARKLKLKEKYKKRAISEIIKNLSKNNSLAEIYFIIDKLYSLKNKKPYLLIKYISILLDKFIRDVYRKEIKKSIKILEEVHEMIPQKYYYNLSKLKLGIFYYFNLEHDKAINIFKKTNLKYLKLKSKLDYYLNFSKANIFSNNVKVVQKLLRKGNILAKENNMMDYRYFLFNVKGMLYARLNKNNLSEAYFDIVYDYVLKNGFHQEIINFANNYFLIMYRVNKTKKIKKKAHKLLTKLDTSKYENIKATIYIYDQLARVNRKTNNYKKSLEYRNKAYDIAYDIQNIDEMIQMKENSIIPKYYLNFDKNIIISDLKKVIDLSIKYQREEKAINSYNNLIILYMETGNLSKALDFYKKAISFFNLDKLEYLKYFSLLQRGINIYAELNAKTKVLNLFKTYYEKLTVLRENRFLIHKIEYLETKCMYYYTIKKYDKFLFWHNKYLSHYEYLESNNILSFSMERLIQTYLDKIEVLYLQGKSSEKQKVWKKIETKFGKIRELSSEDSEINYSYYQSLMTENTDDKVKLLKKALDHTIKHKNYLNIENIIEEFLNHVSSNTYEYYNMILILLLSFKKFLNNLPNKYKDLWLNKSTVQQILNILNSLTSFSEKKLISLETSKLFSKMEKSFLTNLDIKTIDIKKINRLMWNSHPDKYLNKICNFLKNSFMATRLILKINNNLKINKADKNLYSEEAGIKKDLIENAYIKGDFVIENEYSFGDSISTIVIPIINPYNKNLYKATDKRSKSMSYHDYYFGYIYMDSKYPLSNINPSTIKYLKSFIEFISLYITHEKTHKELVLDSLTNIYTREHFLKLVKRKFSHAKKKDNQSLFMLIDIDYFKHINDTFGHQKGDEVLEKIAALLKENIRTNDLMGRYGGEEFIIFMENINKEEADQKAENIRKKVQNSNLLPDREITVSIGCSMFPKNSQWINILINQADIAMYNAKKTGRNKVVFWNKNLKIQKPKTNLLAGIITDDLMRSKHKIRNIIEILNFENYNFDELLTFFVEKLKYLIPNKYYYIDIKKNNNKYLSLSEEVSVNSSSFNEIESNTPHIFVNWKYFETEEDILHNDLVYILEHKNIKGAIILSIATKNKNYNINEKNLLEKLVKLLILKITSLD
ncbi:MAG: diguanylate cyclase [Candidatus Mcinerneyibacterium aminivorans]|uniref:Diguanylate cyclase n=1 Tax=Candidatus Mcinerneyibacterium aminivorans TaxID=2703815 RepID=A0A5D0MJZ5_9BACT|nr:MAG: diguanylate cyclase [Candidatus Mcinerneyibacterium aminivorans]